MDAVDPALVGQAEQTLQATAGVLGTGQVRLRWIGHQLRAECEVIVDPGITAIQAHQITVAAEHGLLHAVPRLSAALVHADPLPDAGADLHQALTSHRPPATRPPPPPRVAKPRHTARVNRGTGPPRAGRVVWARWPVRPVTAARYGVARFGGPFRPH